MEEDIATKDDADSAEKTLFMERKFPKLVNFMKKRNFNRRIVNRLGDGVGYTLGGGIAGIGATGALTTRAESDGLDALFEYAGGAVTGYTEIPQKIRNTINNAEVVVESAGEINEAMIPAREDLDTLVGQLTTGSEEFSVTEGLGTASRMIAGEDGQPGSAVDFLTTLQDNEQQLEGYTVDQVSELGELVQNAMYNLHERPLAAVVAAGILAAGLGTVYAASRATKKKLGVPITTVAEDGIYLGTKLVLGTAAKFAFATGAAYALAAESTYSKLMASKELLTEKFGVALDTIQQYAPNFATSPWRKLSNRFQEGVEGGLDATGGALRWLGDKTGYDWLSRVGETTDSLEFQRWHLEPEALNKMVGTTQEAIDETVHAYAELQPMTETEAFVDYMSRFDDGVRQGIDLAQRVWETDPEQLTQITDAMGQAVPGITESVMNGATNLGEHTPAVLAFLAVTYFGLSSIPFATGITLNSANDRLTAWHDKRVAARNYATETPEQLAEPTPEEAPAPDYKPLDSE
ncbi:hypothetical protein ACFL1B_01255 [Nanoarchaeota archaeon]